MRPLFFLVTRIATDGVMFGTVIFRVLHVCMFKYPIHEFALKDSLFGTKRNLSTLVWFFLPMDQSSKFRLYTATNRGIFLEPCSRVLLLFDLNTVMRCIHIFVTVYCLGTAFHALKSIHVLILVMISRSIPASHD